MRFSTVPDGRGRYDVEWCVAGALGGTKGSTVMAFGQSAQRASSLSPEGRNALLGTIGVMATCVLVVFALDYVDLNILIGALTLLTLTIISVPMMRWIARTDGDPTITPILLAALFAKFVFTAIRYFFITVVYQDQGDAGLYGLGGAVFMESFRKGKFVTEIPELETRGPEVMRIAFIVGLIYVVTGVSRYAASFVFGWFCFMGQVLMVRAFRRGAPSGDHRRYLLMVMFLPSMLFWPSSIGKESLMVLSIGIASYGASLLLGDEVRSSGIPIFVLGSAGLFYIRPHMALIAVVSLGTASAVNSIVGFSKEMDKRSQARVFAVRMVLLLVLIGGASAASTQLAETIGGSQGGGTGIEGVLNRTKSQTALGGSEYASVAVSTPLDFPAAFVTVLFRPFPWEAGGANGLIAASEGLLLAALIIAGRRRLVSWGRSVARQPYLIYAGVFSMVFIVAFSYIGNFGILARQRTQMMPLALTFLAMPIAARKRASWFGEFASKKVRDAGVLPAKFRADQSRERVDH